MTDEPRPQPSDPPPTDPHDLVWRALSDPTRRSMLDELRTGRKTTGQLVDAFDHLSRFGVMKHLGVLEQAGLIVVRREGRVRWNHLNAVPLREIYERWVSRFEDQWAGSLLRLRDIAEQAEPGPEQPEDRPEDPNPETNPDRNKETSP